MNRLAACLLVGVLVAVVVYMYFQDTEDSTSSNDKQFKPKQANESNDDDDDDDKIEEQEEINTNNEEEVKTDTTNNVIDEGVIKYDCEWIKRDIKLNAIKTLLNARNRLHELGLIDVYKHNGIGFGNISQRIQPDDDTFDMNTNNKVPFYITGSQTSLIDNNKMNETHFSIVNNYNISQNKLYCIGPIRASSESMTHATIYELDPNINCVVHIHNNKLWNICIDKLPSTDRKVAYGTPAMAQEVRRIYEQNIGNVQNMKVFVMGGHEDGLIAFGESIETATELMINVYKKYCNGGIVSESTSIVSEEETINMNNIQIIENYSSPERTAVNDMDERKDDSNGKNGEFVQVESIESDPLVI